MPFWNVRKKSPDVGDWNVLSSSRRTDHRCLWEKWWSPKLCFYHQRPGWQRNCLLSEKDGSSWMEPDQRRRKRNAEFHDFQKRRENNKRVRCTPIGCTNICQTGKRRAGTVNKESIFLGTSYSVICNSAEKCTEFNRQLKKYWRGIQVVLFLLFLNLELLTTD